MIPSLQELQQVISDESPNSGYGNGRPASLEKKAKEIHLVLSEPDVDLWKLREFALTEGGLVNDALRRLAWPKLVGLQEQLYGSEEDKRKMMSCSSSLGSSMGSCSTRRTCHQHGYRPSPPSHPPPQLPGTPPRVPRGAASSPSSSKSTQLESFLSGRNGPGDDDASVCSASTCASNSTTSSIMSSSPDRRRGGRGSRSLEILATCLDSDQIERDVTRCTWHLLTGTQRIQRLQMENKRYKKVARLIRRKQRRLANLINYTLLQSYPNGRAVSDEENDILGMRYYQGYHDVACIFLSTLGGSSTSLRCRSSAQGPLSPFGSTLSVSTGLRGAAASMGLELPAAVLLQVSRSHLADCLKNNFLHLQTALRLTMFPLISHLDPEVHEHLLQCDMEPYFALSWVITWFSHEVRDTDMVKRLFDVFLVSHPLMPIYLSVAMVLQQNNRAEVLNTDCDFASLHQVLASLPKNSSMVGWKYRPGDGYVSDDEEEEDDDDDNQTVATKACLTELLLSPHSVSSGTPSSLGLRRSRSPPRSGARMQASYAKQLEMLGLADEPPRPTEEEAQSLVSSSISSVEAPARVPFQELIDTAIQYMRVVPPGKLLDLARRYHGKKEVEFELQRAPNITLLHPVPATSWALKSTTKADWVLKQRRLQERMQRERSSRRDRKREKRRHRSRSRSCDRRDESDNTSTTSTVSTAVADGSTGLPAGMEEAIERYLREMSHTPAVIACGFGGFGPGYQNAAVAEEEDPEERRRRRRRDKRRRKALLVAAAAVAVIAVAVEIKFGTRRSRGGPQVRGVLIVPRVAEPTPPLPLPSPHPLPQQISDGVEEESALRDIAKPNPALPSASSEYQSPAAKKDTITGDVMDIVIGPAFEVKKASRKNGKLTKKVRKTAVPSMEAICRRKRLVVVDTVTISAVSPKSPFILPRGGKELRPSRRMKKPPSSEMKRTVSTEAEPQVVYPLNQEEEEQNKSLPATDPASLSSWMLLASLIRKRLVRDASRSARRFQLYKRVAVDPTLRKASLWLHPKLEASRSSAAAVAHHLDQVPGARQVRMTVWHDLVLLGKTPAARWMMQTTIEASDDQDVAPWVRLLHSFAKIIAGSALVQHPIQTLRDASESHPLFRPMVHAMQDAYLPDYYYNAYSPSQE